jgi:prepilin signal peptidase PulO-like enzyme (type II secretory pathway)
MYAIYAAAAFFSGIAGGFAIARLTKPEDIYAAKNRKRTVLICVLCAAAFEAALYHGYGEDVVTEFISCFFTVFFMLWLAVTDVTGFVLPNKIILLWLACRVFFITLSGVIDRSLVVPAHSLAGALIVGALFLIMYYASKRTLGGGDVKLSFVLGLSLTLTNVFNAVFYGLIACALFAAAGIAVKKLKGKDLLPLGPFLFIGTLIAYLL